MRGRKDMGESTDFFTWITIISSDLIEGAVGALLMAVSAIVAIVISLWPRKNSGRRILIGSVACFCLFLLLLSLGISMASYLFDYTLCFLIAATLALSFWGAKRCRGWCWLGPVCFCLTFTLFVLRAMYSPIAPCMCCGV